MKIAPSEQRPKRRAVRSETVILFLVAGETFAISAGAVQEVRSTDSLSGAASEVARKEWPHVRHRIRRGRKFYYVVDACAHFGLAAVRPALVLVLRHSRVAVLVERIERMETISHLLALPPSFRGAERRWYRGLTVIRDQVVPVVSSAGFLADQELERLDACLPAEEAEIPVLKRRTADEIHGAKPS